MPQVTQQFHCSIAWLRWKMCLVLWGLFYKKQSWKVHCFGIFFLGNHSVIYAAFTLYLFDSFVIKSKYMKIALQCTQELGLAWRKVVVFFYPSRCCSWHHTLFNFPVLLFSQNAVICRTYLRSFHCTVSAEHTTAVVVAAI